MKGCCRWDVTKKIIQDWKIESIHILTLCITVILFQSPINGLAIKKKKTLEIIKESIQSGIKQIRIVGHIDLDQQDNMFF